MNTHEAAAWASNSWETRTIEQGISILQVGSRVRVTSYGPFRGLRGTIRTVDPMPGDFQEPFGFYLVALDGTSRKDPIWFACDEVEPVASSFVALQTNG